MAASFFVSVQSLQKGVAVTAMAGMLLLGGLSQAQAAYVRGAVNVWTTAGQFDSTGDYAVTNIIDQSGLSAGYVSGVTDYDSYVASTTHAWEPAGNEWWTPFGVDATGDFFGTNEGYVLFDLGANYVIDGVALWNEDWAGISNVNISVFDVNDGLTSAGLFSPTNVQYERDYLATDLNFSESYYTRFLLFGLTGASFDFDDGTGDRGMDQPTISIGEVAFSEVEPVPEPATILLFSAGALGLIGMRKRGK